MLDNNFSLDYKNNLSNDKYRWIWRQKWKCVVIIFNCINIYNLANSLKILCKSDVWRKSAKWFLHHMVKFPLSRVSQKEELCWYAKIGYHL